MLNQNYSAASFMYFSSVYLLKILLYIKIAIIIGNIVDVMAILGFVKSAIIPTKHVNININNDSNIETKDPIVALWDDENSSWLSLFKLVRFIPWNKYAVANINGDINPFIVTLITLNIIMYNFVLTRVSLVPYFLMKRPLNQKLIDSDNSFINLIIPNIHIGIKPLK